MSEITKDLVDQNDALPRNITLSESAIKRLTELFESENSKKMLRVYVNGGGCSGFTYGFSFDDKLSEGDHLFEIEGIKVISDDAS